MEGWLSCTISPGQFTGEFAVRSKMFDATEFSLFAPKEDLRFDKEPTEKNSEIGSMRVSFVQEEDDLIMVMLPRPTFENGRMVTVKREQVNLEGSR